ncbi:MAG: DUF3352 domain-containing protein, partial [Actinobacteria bacterium]|nr:DUF3352 domain-containing protein [Actinomycetota bacterium]
AALTVDLDPAADQKVAAYRLTKKFPQLKTRGEGTVISDLLRQALESTDQVDFAKDVEPWLGDRIGIAAVPAGDTVAPVVAVQVTDRDKARTGLRKLIADSEEDVAFAFVADEDWAVLAPTQQLADRYAAADEHLGDTDAYTEAVAELKGNQVATAWVDVAGAYAAAPDELRGSVEPKGYVVAGVHVGDAFLEVTGESIGVAEKNAALTKPTRLVQQLPSDVVAAVGAAGVGEALQKGLKQQQAAVAQLEQLTGLSVADDLPALLGTDAVVALLGEGGSPGFAVRTTTKDPDRALTSLQRVLQTLGDPALVRRTSDGLVGGSTAAVVDRVAADGTLGEQDAFRRAVPDADDAGLVVFVDVPRAVRLFGPDSSQLERVEAFGMTASADSSGDGSFRLRVTFR